MDAFLKLLIYLIMGLIAYIYVGYPLILAFLGLFAARRRGSGGDQLPTVALIVSAHNEERIIREKIENCLKLDYPRNKLKIVVSSDGSEDGTNGIVREYEGRGVVLKAFDRREGKSAILNKTVLGMDEDILVFSDANAFYKEDALLRLVGNFDVEETGCVVGRLVYMDNKSYVGQGESLYWRYEGLLNRLESRLGSVLVATGTIMAIRRKLFRPVMKDVANDFQLPAEIASQGYAVVYEPAAIALERSTYFFREEFSRKRRIVVRGLTGYSHLRYNFGGGLRQFQFISRKLLRWCVGVALPVVYAASIFLLDEPFILVFFILQNIFYIFALIGAILRRGHVRTKIFFIPFYFVMVNGAAMAAIFTFLSGGRLSSWEKAETTRNVEENSFVEPVLKVIEGRKKISSPVEKYERIT
ncbi:MAG: glycosyltransferase family 2 protein [Candidatus Krumholzibacteria bacterium]|nr:glycosyltransferase family 2 protein [Candidatus Krumholzibacteria bacterium]